jgi:ABC-2 type transport system ATP-binding protein
VIPFVQIQDLSKSFVSSSIALDHIQAEFPLGQMIGLVGPDGAGKTTLIRLLTGLLLPSSGNVCIGGYDTATQAEKIQEMTSYMPQRFGLYEDLTVMENLQLYADLRGVDRKKMKETFEKLFMFSGLGPFTQRFARDLSGGMKQKLGLSCALLKKPKLLLLDEPSVGVDPVSRRGLWNVGHSLLDPEICIVWSTAYLNEAEKCDQVLLLNEGKLHFFGKPQDLTKRVSGKVFRLEHIENKRLALRQLMEIEGVLDGVIEGADLRLIVTKPIVGFDLKKTTPRFEDAFIYLLKKEKTVESLYRFESISRSEVKKSAVEFPVIAEGLTKRFGDFCAASQVSFKVKRGEVFGLLGPNGAGKSTTFKMLCGLLKPSQGSALINGMDVAQARSHIGYMAQKFSLYGNITVGQNLDFFSSVYGSNAKAKTKAIEMFGLGPYLHRISDTLPIGFKQRLSFAAAIMHSPEVLFLDEPTSGMDPIARRAFWRQISQLAIDGCTIMVTTHFMDEAENCDRIALLYQGKIIHMGDSDSLKSMAKTEKNPNPTLDDAFVKLIEESDA